MKFIFNYSHGAQTAMGANELSGTLLCQRVDFVEIISAQPIIKSGMLSAFVSHLGWLGK
jgi:hypothetical protein